MNNNLTTQRRLLNSVAAPATTRIRGLWRWLAIFLPLCAVALPSAADCRWHDVRVRPGHTLGGILGDLGVHQSDVLGFLHDHRLERRARDIRAGQVLHACLDGRPKHRRILALRVSYHHGRTILAASDLPPPKPQLTAAISAPPESLNIAPQRLQAINLTVNGNSLISSLHNHHISPALASEIHTWVQDNANLPEKLAPGTQISLLLYNKKTGADPQQELLRMTIRHDHQVHQLFSYNTADHVQWLLNSHGMGILHVPLKQPVVYDRISSGFGWRIHPILHRPEFHEGIDFATPMGTPIHAAAAGTVMFVGWERGYGRLVILKNAPGVQTRYAHMSRFADGIRRGQRVNTDQVIGYVGSTGLSTGPHLYYQLYLQGHPVDPLHTKAVVPAILHGSVMPAFTRYKEQLNALVTTAGLDSHQEQPG